MNRRITTGERAPARQVRAVFDANTVVVYQAYSPAIAEPAIAAGRFVPPFKLDRTTWIKPSFLWMMYRCGWASKPGQERVLAITITREAFDWALTHSSLSHHDPAVYASHHEWVERKDSTNVRIQWDPDRSLLLEPLDHRAIQIGLSGEAARRYVKDWTESITDITSLAHEIHELVTARGPAIAAKSLPSERPYPLSNQLKAIIGATSSGLADTSLAAYLWSWAMAPIATMLSPDLANDSSASRAPWSMMQPSAQIAFVANALASS